MKNWNILFVIMLAFTACSVKYSFTGASISPDVKTVSINRFENQAQTVEPNLANKLTESLKDKFLSETSLSLVRANGDLNFDAIITTYNVSIQGVQSNDVPAKNRLTISVKVKFANAKEPLKNFETSFTRYADFPSEKNLSDVESDLIRDISDQLIDDIFLKSVADW